MRNRVGIAPAIAVIAAFVLPWNSAPDARARAVSDHFALHVLRLKPPPVTAYRNAGGFVRRYWGDFSPTGVDGAVNMVMFDGCCNVIRYSIGLHTWLPGVSVSSGSDSAIVPTSKRFVWILPSVIRSGFYRSKHLPLITGKSLPGIGRWADIGGLAPVAGGNGWIAGWYGHSFQWSHAALEFLKARPLRAGPAIRVPDPYAPEGVSVGPDGKVWMFDPWTKCNGVSCIGPRFISYDPALRRFASYVVPRSIWPRGWREENYTRLTNLSYTSKIAVAPNGTVWAVFGGEWSQRCPDTARVCGVRLFELKDGTIRTGWFQLNMSSRVNTEFGYAAPLILDTHGNPWLCGPKGKPEVVNAVTWSVRAIPVHGGTLTEDLHHNVWYVQKQKGDLSVAC